MMTESSFYGFILPQNIPEAYVAAFEKVSIFLFLICRVS